MLELDNTTIYVLRNPSCRLINELLSPSAPFFYLRTNCSCGLVHATISWTKAMANKLPSCCKYIRIVTTKNEFHPQNNTHERWMQPKYRNNASTTNRLVGKKFTRTLMWFRSAYCFDRFLFRSKCDVRGICMPYEICDACGPWVMEHMYWDRCNQHFCQLWNGKLSLFFGVFFYFLRISLRIK